ncbi:type III pantothenate kinase [Bacteroidales bacterium OttesenSCG-928-A17]|nr:type III pantothenate kinase [Bacteroidales bacterium OttesenSCG-928-A17]
MNIVIDQGNSSAKIAIFDKKKLYASYIYKSLKPERLLKLLLQYSPSQGILCSVGDKNPEYLDVLQSKLSDFVELNAETPLPIKINYKTPETLGKDRVAAVVGAYMQKPGKNLLVIDAGTAITYDFVDSSGTYLGGNISPGMTIRFRALHNYTKRLPMLDEKGDLPEIGYSTDTAIRTGVIMGITREMDSYISEFKKKHNVLTFLTGGHSFYFESRLKNAIFADGNLVLKGLNEILNYQYV